jgi:predicted nucleic acid-binding protein
VKTGSAKYLLDTCVLSELVKSMPDTHVLTWFEKRKAHELYLSAMTWAELQRGVIRLPESKRRAELTLWLQQLDDGFENRVLPFDKRSAQEWAHLTVYAEAQGKPMAAFDSIIAAIARGYGCKLVTRNLRDFADARVELLNPWQDE